MKIYFDKVNLLSFLKQGEEDTVSDTYDEVNRLMKRHLDLVFNFNKNECANNPILLKWLNQLSQGRGNSTSRDEFKDSPFPERPVKNNFRTNLPWDVFVSAFLIDDVKTESLKQSNNILIGNVGEETNLLSLLFCNSLFSLHSVYNIQNRNIFKGWSTLKQDGHIMPCTDIIISDRYLFSKPDKILEKNIFTILSMFSNDKQNTKINIIFFTDPIDEVLRNSIKKRIDNIFNKKASVKVTFVLFRNDRHNRPHDRFIITNYRVFRSGDSFNYYDEKDNIISQGLTLDINSLADEETYSWVSDVQKQYQDLCDNAKNRIFGAKESNFINFK